LFQAFLSRYTVREHFRRALQTVRASQTSLSHRLIPGTTVCLVTLAVSVAVAVADEYAPSSRGR